MNLYFEIGDNSWVCVRNCADWDDACNILKRWWDVRNIKCIDENDFKSTKRNLVITF